MDDVVTLGLTALLGIGLAGVVPPADGGTQGAPAPPAKERVLLIQKKRPALDQLSFDEIEQLYLNGKISAREFQKGIEMTLTRAQTPAQSVPDGPLATNNLHVKAISVLRGQEPDPTRNPPPGPVMRSEDLPPWTPMSDAEEIGPTDQVTEIEQKVEELMRLRIEREKAARSNQWETVAQDPAKPKTKRQRLDELLRLHIYGELTKEDYEKKRAEILAEPD